MTNKPEDFNVIDQNPQVIIDALLVAEGVFTNLLKEAQKRGDLAQEVRCEKQLEETRNWLVIFREKTFFVGVSL